MNLSYKKIFPDGTPTYFKEKILKGAGLLIDQEGITISGGIDLLIPKLHTIREDPHGRWMSGKKIHHCYGNRTKQYECFLLNTCINTQRIVILKHPLVAEDPTTGITSVIGESRMVMVDGLVMNKEQIEKIAINDGFPSVEKFFEWFKEDFSGVIIHWTKLKY